MGCGRAKAAEDEDDYHRWCAHFNERPTRSPYGDHAKLVEKLYREEMALHGKNMEILAARRSALEKLSSAERRALGLKDD